MELMQDIEKKFTLLAGEGDFSFAACYIQKAKKSPNEHIYATCLQSKSLNPKQEVNIQSIKNNGGFVFTDVDATKLEKHSAIKSILFSKVIFNFPHVAKKMNIGDNRNLVDRFLKSAENALEENGRIYVALCKGQGGTEVETVTRDWNDTWKIVSLAANSNLMLCDIEFFDTCHFETYECTGFRGLEKPFSREKAVTHVFCRGQSALHEMENIERNAMKCDDEYFLDNITELYESTSRAVDSPSVRIASALDRTARKSFLTLKNVFISNLWICKDSFQRSSWPKQAITQELQCDMKPNYCDECLNRFLSLCIKTSEQNAAMVTSVLFSLCCASNFQLSMTPFLRCVSYTGCCEKSLMEGLNSLFSVLKADILRDGFLFSWFDIGSNFMENYNVLDESWDLSYDDICITARTPINASFSITKSSCSLFYTDLNVSISDGTDLVSDSKNKYFELGHIVKFNHNNTKYVCALLNLDVISALKFHVMDYRILLLKEAFFSDKICKEVPQTVFRSPSLHPPTYSHDISFWIPNEFQEKHLYTVARNAFGFLIKNIQLVDVYHNELSKKESRCYRFVYQSCYQVLSKDGVSTIHNHMRKVIEESLKVQLR